MSAAQLRCVELKDQASRAAQDFLYPQRDNKTKNWLGTTRCATQQRSRAGGN